MSVIKSHDINELRSILPYGKVEPGDIVKHVEDSNSFGTVVHAEPKPTTPPLTTKTSIPRYPRELPVVIPVPERDITVLWTKEPRIIVVQGQSIKNKSPSPIKTRWDIEELDDMTAYHSIDSRVRLGNRRQFVTEETYNSIDHDHMDDLHQKGADIELDMDGTVRVRRTLPFTPENIRKYNAVRGGRDDY